MKNVKLLDIEDEFIKTFFGAKSINKRISYSFFVCLGECFLV